MPDPSTKVSRRWLSHLRGLLRNARLELVARAGDQLQIVYLWDARREARRILPSVQNPGAESDPCDLRRFESSRFSQNGEDGVISELFRRLGPTNRFFIEIGASDGQENCTRALAESGWRGIWVESDADRAADAARVAPSVKVLAESAKRDTVRARLASAGAPAEPDLLVVDIDGDDLGVVREVCALRPRLLVVEYNAAFPPGAAWALGDLEGGWDHTFRHGASLTALQQELDRLGYALVYCESTGVNAFFVRRTEPESSCSLRANISDLQRPFTHSGHPFGHVRSKNAMKPMGPMGTAEFAKVGIRVGTVETQIGPPQNAGSIMVFTVFVENGSNRVLTSGEPNGVRLVIGWPRGEGDWARPIEESPRTPLPRPISPGTTSEILLWAALPVDDPGPIVVTLVHEGVAWRSHLDGPLASAEVVAA